jgi:hypothetical protein
VIEPVSTSESLSSVRGHAGWNDRLSAKLRGLFDVVLETYECTPTALDTLARRPRVGQSSARGRDGQ